MNRPGLTLVEVVVALALAATTALLAHAVLGAVASAAADVVTSGAVADARANGERELRRLVASAEGGTPARAMRGDTSFVSWSTWCRASGGWLERCLVRLSIRRAHGGEQLVLRMPNGDERLVQDSLRDPRLAYLVSGANGGRWIASWTDSHALPLAVALLTDNQILLFRTGARN